MTTFAKADRRKPRLTAREIEAMTWTARGKTGGEVATIMNIKEDTVRAHVENVRQKLKASNKTHAVALALAQKLIAPEPIWTSGETNTPFSGNRR
ncbi:helix-turn-helix transcriptional regulator [Hyphomicrobium sp.]|jgi:LuxR family quorum sensing-dependent transcriptional regulator|uniref:helix-turn-helix transcriptional regulator n=1 Tax=Hyphomicrobium sp. TaxID=82 RepID=UPI003564B48A